MIGLRGRLEEATLATDMIARVAETGKTGSVPCLSIQIRPANRATS